MNAYAYLRDEIIPSLEKINNNRQELITSLNTLPEEQEQRIKAAEGETEGQKAAFTETIGALGRFIRMASGGEQNTPSERGRVSSVNLMELKRLCSTEPVDAQGHQFKLLEEASAQYRFVDMKSKALDAQLATKTGQIRQQTRERKEELERELDYVEERYTAFFETDTFSRLVEMTRDENRTEDPDHPILGYIKVPLPVSEKAAARLQERWPDLFDADGGTVSMAYTHDLSMGGVFRVETDGSCESEAMDGIRRLAVAAAVNPAVEQIGFFDPVRYNDDMLGPLAPIAGMKGSPVTGMPLTDNEITKRVLSLHEEMVRWNADMTAGTPHRSNRVLVFYRFPGDYNSETVKRVRYLCINARRHGYTIFLIDRQAGKNAAQSSEMDYILEYSVRISGRDGSFVLADRTNMGFRWAPAPAELPDAIRDQLRTEDSAVNFDNSYENRVGYTLNIPQKGNRSLSNIPYGIDDSGNIATLNFEDEHYGTFICGAAGSGKTTLLHSIIAGFLTRHPDDIELWLIDFKKVEFAQYITHLPPHVRYVLLDNSPEIIFDIIDELTDRLRKRKELFRANGWTNFRDVPSGRPMTEIVVVIDEFSEMSGVLADSVSLSGNGGDYREKFQFLFSEGRSFGFRFILSCQAFSEGTRGLAEFAKMQIQQRIVMKSQRSEIRGTLDVGNLSDEDSERIENLEPHYALQRIPLDTRGNRLKKVHVLYTPDKEKHFAWIDDMRRRFTPARRYVPDDNRVYGDKLPITIDGNSYAPFKEAEEHMKQYIDKQREQYTDDLMLFVGTPLRMNPIMPVSLCRDVKENLLIISPNTKMMLQASIILSIRESACMQSVRFEVLAPRRSPLTDLLEKSTAFGLKVCVGAEAVAGRLGELERTMKQGNTEKHIIVLLEQEQLARELSIRESAPVQASTPDYLGIRHRLNADAPGDTATPRKMPVDYDRILRTLLTEGSVYGYHFVLFFHSAAGYTQSRLPDAFRHKILFKTSAGDASALMIPSAQAARFAAIGEFEYRYTNGLDKNTYRPFFHPLLTWDEREMDMNGEIHSIHATNQDDYLA